MFAAAVDFQAVISACMILGLIGGALGMAERFIGG